MDLFFQPRRGTPFTIEVGYFDTVLEIKEQVEKYQGIPVSAQTLVFKGNVLHDELNIHSSDILDRSLIELIVTPHPESYIIRTEESSLPPNSKEILLHLKMPPPLLVVIIAVETRNTIRRLKELVHAMIDVPINQLVLQTNGFELHDNRTIHDYSLMNRSEIEVSIRPSSTAGSSGSGSGRFRVVVLTECRTMKIHLEVNPEANVAELRKELQRLNPDIQFGLPPEGYYFFVYKQMVMYDDRSFIWHHVGPGDVIEIYSGSDMGRS